MDERGPWTASPRRWARLAAASGGVALLMALTVPAAGAATSTEDCVAAFGNAPFSDGPTEGRVGPGEALSLDVAWGSSFEKGSPVDVLACAALDNVFLDVASTRVSGDNQGLFVHRFAVPADAPAGARLCEAAVVTGRSATGQPRAERIAAECLQVATPGAALKAVVAVLPAPAAPPGPVPPAAPAVPAPTTPAPTTPASAAAAPAPRIAASFPAGSPVSATAQAEVAPVQRGSEHGVVRSMPRTGTHSRLALALAGMLLLAGGFGVALGHPWGMQNPAR